MLLAVCTSTAGTGANMTHIICGPIPQYLSQGHPEKLPKFPEDVVVGQTIKIVR